MSQTPAVTLAHSEAAGPKANEDAFVVQPHPREPDCLLVFVADGQGGRPGGADASRIACATALGVASALDAANLRDQRSWLDVIRAADHAVAADSNAGYTTLVGLVMFPGGLVGASCGDSALLVSDADGLREPTSRQRKNPPVGSGAAAPVVFVEALKGQYRVAAMTDGVWKYAGWDKVRDAVRDGIYETLRAAAAMANGRLQDDFTLVVLEGGRPDSE